MLDDTVYSGKTPETKTQEQMQRTPTISEVTTGLEESATIDIYVEERFFRSEISDKINVVAVYLRPTSQKLELDPASNLINSYALEGIDVEKARVRMLPCLEELGYRKEVSVGDAWEYIYPYARRGDIKSVLGENIKKIKRECCI
jgi:hypothetical protein